MKVEKTLSDLMNDLRPVLVPKNSEKLTDAPYRYFREFCVVLAVQGEEGTGFLKYSHLDKIGISADQAFDRAFANISDADFRIYDLDAFILPAMMEDKEFCILPWPYPIDIEEYIPPAMAITSVSRMYGASVLLADSFLEGLREKVGDYYIIPSSVHEVIVAPSSFMDDPEQDSWNLQGMLLEVNQTLNPEDILSDTLYRFSERGLEVAESVGEVIA